MRTELLYLAWNRMQFVTATWSWMLAHTNWELVDKLVVYDDGSEDGALEFLREQVAYARLDDIDAELRVSDLRSPGAVMNHYVATSEADYFAKIDNDIALPGGWLEAMLSVIDDHPEIDLLGMEAGMAEPPKPRKPDKYGFQDSSHIGGVGLMRVEFFKSHPPIATRTGSRHGFTDWQNRWNPVRGWITPDLLVPQLDRIPAEPWQSLSDQYIDARWQRKWPKYGEDALMRRYWKWTLPKVPA